MKTPVLGHFSQKPALFTPDSGISQIPIRGVFSGVFRFYRKEMVLLEHLPGKY
jgi:hypothetical protein